MGSTKICGPRSWRLNESGHLFGAGELTVPFSCAPHLRSVPFRLPRVTVDRLHAPLTGDLYIRYRFLTFTPKGLMKGRVLENEKGKGG